MLSKNGFRVLMKAQRAGQALARRESIPSINFDGWIQELVIDGVLFRVENNEVARATGAPLTGLEDGAAQCYRDEVEAGWSRWVNEIASALDSEPMYADEESEISKGMTLDEWQAWTDQLIRETQQSG